MRLNARWLKISEWRQQLSGNKPGLKIEPRHHISGPVPQHSHTTNEPEPPNKAA